MSLKAFHIVFVVASVLIAWFFAAWLVQGYSETGSQVMLWGGVASGLAGVGLVAYGRYVLNKLKDISYL